MRTAGPQDAEQVAWLHADSWRRHYRGAYADEFLDGDVEADRRAVWKQRLDSVGGARTVLIEDDDGIAGFAHVVFDADPVWGSFVDNLHVRHDRQRGGLGRALMVDLAAAVAPRDHTGMFLWVLRQNTRAQAFYTALGGRAAESKAVPPPGGVPQRLIGEPQCLRMVWRDVTRFG